MHSPTSAMSRLQNAPINYCERLPVTPEKVQPAFEKKHGHFPSWVQSQDRRCFSAAVLWTQPPEPPAVFPAPPAFLPLQRVLWEKWQTALIRPHPPSLPSISTLGVSSPAAQRWQTSTPSSNQCLLPLTLCFLLSLPFLLIFTMSNSFSLCLSAAGQPPCCSPLWNFRSGPGPWHLRRDVSSRLIGQRAEWCPHIRTARGGAVLL